MTTFTEFRDANMARSREWHKNAITPWNGSDWGNALAGEVGELCNEIKKFRRMETGVKPWDQEKIDGLKQKIADEAADVFLYLDLICAFYDVDLQYAIANKFNFVSDREGLSEFKIEPKKMKDD